MIVILQPREGPRARVTVAGYRLTRCDPIPAQPLTAEGERSGSTYAPSIPSTPPGRTARSRRPRTPSA